MFIVVKEPSYPEEAEEEEEGDPLGDKDEVDALLDKDAEDEAPLGDTDDQEGGMNDNPEQNERELFGKCYNFQFLNSFDF